MRRDQAFSMTENHQFRWGPYAIERRFPIGGVRRHCSVFWCKRHGQALLVQATPGQPISGATAGFRVSAQTWTKSRSIWRLRIRSTTNVLDLKPEDFVITDNDVPVKLNTFQLVQGECQSDQLVTMVFDHFDGSRSQDRANHCPEDSEDAFVEALFVCVVAFGNRMQSDCSALPVITGRWSRR